MKANYIKRLNLLCLAISPLPNLIICTYHFVNLLCFDAVIFGTDHNTIDRVPSVRFSQYSKRDLYTKIFLRRESKVQNLYELFPNYLGKFSEIMVL